MSTATLSSGGPLESGRLWFAPTLPELTWTLADSLVNSVLNATNSPTANFTTVTTTVQVAVLLAASLTVMVMVVVPTPTSVPATGDCVMTSEPEGVQLSVATTAPVRLGKAT